jgi:hypothetical protein
MLMGREFGGLVKTKKNLKCSSVHIRFLLSVQEFWLKLKKKKKKCWVFLLSAMASENICVQRRQKYYRSPDVERFAL